MTESWEQKDHEEGLWGTAASNTPVHIPTHRYPRWGLLPCMSRGTRLLPEGGGAGAGVPNHTEHTQALGEQHKGQQDPIQE